MTEASRQNASAMQSSIHGLGETARAAPLPLHQPLDRQQQAAAGIRLVIVDDDDNFREAIGGELIDLGFEVVDFAAPAPMFEYFAEGGSADVVVLDWRMPGITGIELLGQMRRRGINLPVIFLTGMLAAAYENAALENGALDFVNKSRGAAILAKRLQLVHQAGKKPPEQDLDDTLICGELVLKPRISRATWRGIDVNLTVVEFNIVHLLARSAGEYATYRAIYDCVHHVGFIAGAGEDGYRTNVRSSIKRIRNKFRCIDADFSEIENFLAFGYRWRSAGNAPA